MFFYEVVLSNSVKIINPSSASEFYDIVSSGTVFVEFKAQWCNPCKIITPYYESLTNQYSASGTKYLKVDIDEQQEVAFREGISTIPAFYVYKDGQKVDEMIGANRANLEALFKSWA